MAVGADRLERLSAVGDSVDSIAGTAEDAGEVFPHVGVVVRDQHMSRYIQLSRFDDRGQLRPSIAGQPLQGLLYEWVGDRGRHPRAAAGGDRIGRQVRGAERQADGESGARAFGAVGGNAAAVQADQFFDQSQPDSAAFVGACADHFDAVESLEQPGHLCGRHADPGVGDRDHRGTVRAPHPNGDRPVEGEFQRVGQQVEHHLLPHVAVQVHRLVQRRTIHDEDQAGPFHGRAEDAGQLAGHRSEVDRLVAGRHAAGFDAGEVEQRVDQLGEA